MPTRDDERSFYDPPTIAWSLRNVGPHLHPGGEEATVLLAQHAAAHGFPARGRVLDLGSGLGAPSRFVARRFAADVVGVDIERTALAAARDALVAEELHLRCAVVLGAGSALPFSSASFDAAWSQDALCHMQKDAVLGEVARVLRPGGVFAFSDWIARERLSVDELEELRQAWRFPSLLRVEEYVTALERSGFEVLAAEDVTRAPPRDPRAAPSDQGSWEASFAGRWGSDELTRQEERVAAWVTLLEARATGNGVFVARLLPASG